MVQPLCPNQVKTYVVLFNIHVWPNIADYSQTISQHIISWLFFYLFCGAETSSS